MNIAVSSEPACGLDTLLDGYGRLEGGKRDRWVEGAVARDKSPCWTGAGATAAAAVGELIFPPFNATAVVAISVSYEWMANKL